MQNEQQAKNAVFLYAFFRPFEGAFHEAFVVQRPGILLVISKVL